MNAETMDNIETVKESIKLLEEYCMFLLNFGREGAYTDSLLNTANKKLESIIDKK